MITHRTLLAVCFLVIPVDARAEKPAGDELLARYFEFETAKIEAGNLKRFESLDQWESKRSEYRDQLFEMLGLAPRPEKTALKPTTTGVVEQDEFLVENVHFQSRPGLYVTGNLYRPKKQESPLPAILYVCGHGRVKKDGVSYGNKVNYHHHGSWFARNGYVCLTIDTLQLGEIEGIHHGTYREKMWWWLGRGYTPAGVEAWNCVRALDYLESRPEVDAGRIGVTGRSGGGAYSWWIAALDDRIKVAVPVAGITDIRNHVVDGCVEGHCDCMYIVNTYRWDYAQVAALMAPRPLLISNSDRDRIFPLDGVYRTYNQVRHIYSLHDADDALGLNITAGGHADTQELRVHAFRWLNYHLKDGDKEPLREPAVKFFEPEQLKVFDELPSGQTNSTIQDHFVPKASATLPENSEHWTQMAADWKQQLREKTFRGWPDQSEPPKLQAELQWNLGNLVCRKFRIESQAPFELPVILIHRRDLTKPERVVLNVMSESEWTSLRSALKLQLGKRISGISPPRISKTDIAGLPDEVKQGRWVAAFVAPRGIGPTSWDTSERKQTQIRRRFYLLGQTLDGMRVFDVVRALQSLQTVAAEAPFELRGSGDLGAIALYAALFDDRVKHLTLDSIPSSHREGPYLLNVERILDLPQAVALAAEQREIKLLDGNPAAWQYPVRVAEQLGWGQKLTFD